MDLAHTWLSEVGLSVQDTSLWFQEFRLERYQIPLALLFSLEMLLEMLPEMLPEMLVSRSPAIAVGGEC
jgi:hypothetical protein